MNWTPATITGAVLLLAIVVIAVAYLPSEPAWGLLGQIATSAAKMVGG